MWELRREWGFAPAIVKISANWFFCLKRRLIALFGRTNWFIIFVPTRKNLLPTNFIVCVENSNQFQSSSINVFFKFKYLENAHFDSTSEFICIHVIQLKYIRRPFRSWGLYLVKNSNFTRWMFFNPCSIFIHSYYVLYDFSEWDKFTQFSEFQNYFRKYLRMVMICCSKIKIPGFSTHKLITVVAEIFPLGQLAAFPPTDRIFRGPVDDRDEITHPGIRHRTNPAVYHPDGPADLRIALCFAFLFLSSKAIRATHPIRQSNRRNCFAKKRTLQIDPFHIYKFPVVRCRKRTRKIRLA